MVRPLRTIVAPTPVFGVAAPLIRDDLPPASIPKDAREPSPPSFSPEVADQGNVEHAAYLRRLKRIEAKEKARYQFKMAALSHELSRLGADVSVSPCGVDEQHQREAHDAMTVEQEPDFFPRLEQKSSREPVAAATGPRASSQWSSQHRLGGGAKNFFDQTEVEASRRGKPPPAPTERRDFPVLKVSKTRRVGGGRPSAAFRRSSSRPARPSGGPPRAPPSRPHDFFGPTAHDDPAAPSGPAGRGPAALEQYNNARERGDHRTGDHDRDHDHPDRHGGERFEYYGGSRSSTAHRTAPWEEDDEAFEAISSIASQETSTRDLTLADPSPSERAAVGFHHVHQRRGRTFFPDPLQGSFGEQQRSALSRARAERWRARSAERLGGRWRARSAEREFAVDSTLDLRTPPRGALAVPDGRDPYGGSGGSPTAKDDERGKIVSYGLTPLVDLDRRNK